MIKSRISKFKKAIGVIIIYLLEIIITANLFMYFLKPLEGIILGLFSGMFIVPLITYSSYYLILWLQGRENEEVLTKWIKGEQEKIKLGELESWAIPSVTAKCLKAGLEPAERARAKMRGRTTRRAQAAGSGQADLFSREP